MRDEDLRGRSGVVAIKADSDHIRNTPNFVAGIGAFSVLATVKRDGIEARGGTWSAEEERAFKAPLLEQYEHQGHPYYASARLWDDGVIDPAETRRVLGLSLAITLNAPIPATKFGVFRM